jgi:catalase
MNLKRPFSPVLLSLLTLGTVASAQPKPPTLSNDNGAPVGDVKSSQTAGENGPVLLQDWNLVQRLARFDRERIPERVVHARGTGAFGTFEATSDEHALTRAKLFAKPGVKTPVAVRFSSVIHPGGSPESLRDPRGFAVKFYTPEGNYDLVGNNLPVFFIRDAIQFPDMVHSLKPSPATNRQDPNRVFAFMAQNPQSTNMLTHLYSDLGTPAGYRFMDGNGVHAFVWVNDKGQRTYVRYRWKSLQGVKNLSATEAAATGGKDFQYMTTDLYGAIGRRELPKWDLYVQTIAEADLDKLAFNPLDATKLWPEDKLPLHKIGTMTLERMPKSYFEEVEQIAFSPGVMVPGIEASEDRLLQGRLFSYADTQRYRLGANYLDIAVNRPRVAVANYSQDGAFSAKGLSDVNFSGIGSLFQTNATYKYSTRPLAGGTQQEVIKKQGNFAQAGEVYHAMTAEGREHLVSNLAGDLGQVTNKEVKATMAAHFYKADAGYGRAVAKALGLDEAEVARRAATIPE